MGELTMLSKMGVAAFAASIVFCAAVDRAETVSNAGLGPEKQTAVTAFTAEPNLGNLRKIRAALVEDRTYNPYSDEINQLDKLVRAGKHREALALFDKSLPNLVLSSRAHYLASVAAKAMGDGNRAKTELARSLGCIEGIAASG